jgi:hypothetical protein
MEPKMTYRELIAQIEMFPYRMDCDVEIHIDAKNAPNFYKPAPVDMIFREKRTDKFAPKGKGNYARVDANSSLAELVTRKVQLINEQRRTEEETEDHKGIAVALQIVERLTAQKEREMMQGGMTEKAIQSEIDKILKG